MHFIFLWLLSVNLLMATNFSSADRLSVTTSAALGGKVSGVVTKQKTSVHPLEETIRESFAVWNGVEGGKKTALDYAVYLAAQPSIESKKQAQAIIFFGAGFGGFDKSGRTANASEMKQYHAVVDACYKGQLLGGKIQDLLPDRKLFGQYGDNITHHQHTFFLLCASRLNDADASEKQKERYEPIKESLMWLGQYVSKYDPNWKDISHQLGQFESFKEKCTSLYRKNNDAVVMLHPYAGNNEMPHFSFKRKGREAYIVAEETLGWDQKDTILVRPHYAYDSREQVKPGENWKKMVRVEVDYPGKVKSSANVSGESVHIHPMINSPSLLDVKKLLKQQMSYMGVQVDGSGNIVEENARALKEEIDKFLQEKIIQFLSSTKSSLEKEAYDWAGWIEDLFTIRVISIQDKLGKSQTSSAHAVSPLHVPSTTLKQQLKGIIMQDSDHNVASPNNVMQVGKLKDVLARGPHRIKVLDDPQSTTLSILVPNNKSWLFNSEEPFTATQLLGYLAFVYPETTHRDFILKCLQEDEVGALSAS